MPRLLDLPTEVILLVTSHLSAADKASLICVCKVLHQIAELSLYEEVCMKWIERSSIRAEVLPPIHRLLERVSACPQIAKAIKNVRFTGTKSTPLWPSTAESKLSHDDLQRLKVFIQTSGLAVSYQAVAVNAGNKTLGGDEIEPWMRDIMEGEVNIYQALLISHLPNLTHLEVGFDPDKGFEYISATLHNALCSNHMPSRYSNFPHLSRVDLCADMFYRNLGKLRFQYSCDEIYLSEILPFFYLPALQEFRVMMPYGDMPFQWPSVAPDAKALKILRLQRSHISAETLEQLLSVTPNLKILEYDFCSLIEMDPLYGAARNLISDDLDKALSHVKTTLETPRISVHIYDLHGDTDYPLQDTSYGIEGTLRSLKAFHNLIELEAPFALLLGPDSAAAPFEWSELPSNLESLVFRDDLALYQSYPWRSMQVLKRLPAFLAHLSLQSSRLERLGLNVNERLDDWDENSISSYQSLCRSMHVVPMVHKELWDCSCPGTPVFARDRFEENVNH